MSAAVKQLSIETILAAAGAPTVTAAGLLAPSAATATPQGTTGATTYTYKLVSVSASGKRSLATANITTATGNATLTSVNKNHLAWTPAADASLDHVEVYRTAGGATQGYLGTVLAGTNTFDDTGIAAVGAPILPVATTRKYEIVALGSVSPQLSRKRRAVASAEGSSAVGPETLSADTPMHVAFSAVTGATGYLVYRTDTLVTKGLIATLDSATLAFNDVGAAGDGANPNATDETGIGDVVDVRDLGDKYLQLGGTFTAAMQPQGSINGVDWVDEGASFAAAAVRAVAPSYSLMRIKQTAYTSGTPTMHLAGRRVQG